MNCLLTNYVNHCNNIFRKITTQTNIYPSLKSDSQCVWTLDSNVTILSLFISTFLFMTPRIFFAFPEMTELPYHENVPKWLPALLFTAIALLIFWVTVPTFLIVLRTQKLLWFKKKCLNITTDRNAYALHSRRSLILIILVIKRAENFKN